MNQRLFTTTIALSVTSLIILHPFAGAIANDTIDKDVVESTEAEPFSKTKQDYPININDSATIRMVRMCEVFLSDRLGSTFTANINSVRAAYVSNTETRYTGRGSLDNSRRNCEDYRFNCIVNISQSFVSTATASRTGCRMW